MSKTLEQVRKECREDIMIDQGNDALAMVARFGNYDPRFSLRKIRQVKGMSMRQVAERSGVEVATISRFERGLVDCNFSTALKIMMALDCFMLFVGDYMYTPIEYNGNRIPRKSSRALKKSRQGTR